MRLLFLIISLALGARRTLSLNERIAQSLAEDPFLKARIDYLINGMSSLSQFTSFSEHDSDHSFHLHL